MARVGFERLDSVVTLLVRVYIPEEERIELEMIPSQGIEMRPNHLLSRSSPPLLSVCRRLGKLLESGLESLGIKELRTDDLATHQWQTVLSSEAARRCPYLIGLQERPYL